jgi:2OG-Fe(II) oxygenase superfamily
MFGIKNKRWIVNRHPFKHIVARDVFDDGIYNRLCAEFGKRVANKESKRTITKNYDATILPLTDADKANLAPILDLEWLKLISTAMQLDTRFEVDGALHSHPPGSRSGWIHNDYNPGWFARPAAKDEVYLSSRDGCDYKSGKTATASSTPVRRMRYLTLLYYLDNPRWVEGMGGETGIYTSQRRSVDRADRFVPPVNNSLLLFECSPHSWHSFRSGSFARNSITLWLHRDFDQAKKQWPHHEPVYWS